VDKRAVTALGITTTRTKTKMSVDNASACGIWSNRRATRVAHSNLTQTYSASRVETYERLSRRNSESHTNHRGRKAIAWSRYQYCPSSNPSQSRFPRLSEPVLNHNLGSICIQRQWPRIGNAQGCTYFPGCML